MQSVAEGWMEILKRSYIKLKIPSFALISYVINSRLAAVRTAFGTDVGWEDEKRTSQPLP